jgi:hypothetical protein
MSQKYDCVGEAHVTRKAVNCLLGVFTFAIGGVLLIKFLLFLFII